MSLKRNILDLRKRKEIVLQGGGEDAIKKQAAMGKLTARERIEGILDKGSFHEYDMFVEHQSKDFDMDKKVLHGDGVVIGTGTVYGEPVAIYAQDLHRLPVLSLNCPLFWVLVLVEPFILRH